MKQPKVSIIVPVYNVEKYLDRCMQSLLGQTLKELEIILVDDGSRIIVLHYVIIMNQRQIICIGRLSR